MKASKINKLVSVVMPVYNGEQFLKAAIESILNQTFNDFEFIIINDGSTDKSLKIAQSFDDKRIKIIQNPTNKGLVFSLNTGVAEANGKYIARMDADDIALPKRLEKQVDFLKSNPNFVMVGCSATTIDTKNKKIGRWNVKTSAIDIKRKLVFGAPFIHPSILIEKRILLEFPYKKAWFPAEDYFLWFQIAQKYQVANINEPLLLYRIHDNKISKNSNFQQAIKAKQVQALILQHIDVSFSQRELEIHSKIAYNSNTVIIEKNEFVEVENWLLKLLQLDLFKSTNRINIKWWQVCTRYNYGLSTFKIFSGSILSQSISTHQKIELFFRSMFTSLFGQQAFHTLKRKYKWLKTLTKKAFLY